MEAYQALMLILIALIIRGVSFEYRSKSANPRWRATWDWTLTIGSLALPVLLGIGLGDLLSGLPLNQQGTFTGSFWDLFTAYGVWFGLTLLSLTLAHGAMYLSLKTTGTVQARAQRLSSPLAGIAVLFLAGFAIWTHVQSGRGVLPAPLQVLAWLLIVAAAWSVHDGHTGWGFAATTAAIATTLISFFNALYPNVMVSSTNKAYNLTVANSAAGHYSLVVMTVVAVIFAPLVIAYQSWSYHVFRGRIRVPAAQAPSSGAASAPVAGPATDGPTG
jgi:cytochrome d ubiquinol oxidase subunit II